jgi:hypothetical protein
MVKDFKYQMNSYEKNLSIYEEMVKSIPASIRRDRPDASVRK